MVEVMAAGHADAAAVTAALPGVRDVQVFGERLHVTLDDPSDDAVAEFARRLEASPLAGAGVRAVPPSLEDVFIATARTKGAGRCVTRGSGSQSR